MKRTYRGDNCLVLYTRKLQVLLPFCSIKDELKFSNGIICVKIVKNFFYIGSIWNIKVNSVLPECPPLSEIICCSTRCTVEAASSTLRSKAFLRTSRSRSKCCHKYSATFSGSHGGVISWAVAFEGKVEETVI